MTGDAVRGTCFGFSVCSSLPMLYLRDGTGERLDVEWSEEDDARPHGRLVCEWLPKRDPPFHARLYEQGPSYRFWVAGTGTFTVEPEARRISAPNGTSAVKRETRIWGIPALLCFLARGDLPLHAAAVDVDGGAVMLAAPGTFGKTTLAAGFARAGHRVLSEDITCVRVSDEPAVIPGPAAIRLRRDVGTRLGLDFGEARDGEDGRIHVALDEDGRGDCAPVPLRAIVFLRIADDGVSLERAPAATAIRDLWSLSFALPRRAEQARRFAGVSGLATRVPSLDLSRPLRLDNLDELVERIADSV